MSKNIRSALAAIVKRILLYKVEIKQKLFKEVKKITRRCSACINRNCFTSIKLDCIMTKIPEKLFVKQRMTKICWCCLSHITGKGRITICTLGKQTNIIKMCQVFIWHSRGLTVTHWSRTRKQKIECFNWFVCKGVRTSAIINSFTGSRARCCIKSGVDVRKFGWLSEILERRLR